MKKLLLIALVLTGPVFVSQAQTTLTTRTGVLNFICSTPLQKIEAINNSAAVVLSKTTGDFLLQVPTHSFHFEIQVMEQQFNDHYFETDKFPTASFTGKITNLSEIKFDKDGTYKTMVSGKLMIHGVTNIFSAIGTTIVKGKSVNCKALFKVKLSDYHINVPSVVSDKIANEASITVDAKFL